MEDINEYINKHSPNRDQIILHLFANNNTLKTHIKTSVPIHFRDGTIGKLLGFDNQDFFEAGEYVSEHTADIIKVNSLNIDCNIAEGSYLNGQPVHIIHQFFPSVAPGFKIIESPQNIIYFPVTVKVIDNIIVNILDQNGDSVNFRGETITLRLHLKKLDK